MIVAWTGHRPDLFRDPAAARQLVRATARSLASAVGGVQFVVGGQRGVDTWAAIAAGELGIPFSICLPMDPGAFSQDWQSEDRRVLEHLLGLANAVRGVSIAQASGLEQAFTERNRLVVAGADLLVAVWTGTHGGGTAETIALARAMGVPVRETRLEPSAGAATAEGRGV